MLHQLLLDVLGAAEGLLPGPLHRAHQRGVDPFGGARDIVVLLDSAKNAQLLEASNASAVVVRPDRYIFGTASDSAELQDLIELLPLADIQQKSASVFT